MAKTKPQIMKSTLSTLLLAAITLPTFAQFSTEDQNRNELLFKHDGQRKQSIGTAVFGVSVISFGLLGSLSESGLDRSDDLYKVSGSVGIGIIGLSTIALIDSRKYYRQAFAKELSFERKSKQDFKKWKKATERKAHKVELKSNKKAMHSAIKESKRTRRELYRGRN